MKIIRLTPACKDYPWGGALLREKYGVNSDLEPLAEAWVLSCHPDGESIIAEGEHQGQRLSGYAAQYGANFWGTKCEEFGGLPLLIKLIDAKTNLSIQVHPDNAYALEHEHQYGKTEMWYVMEAAPDAYLYYGLKESVTKGELSKSITDGTIIDLLRAVPVHAGDLFFIPAGTIHAICRGTVIAEIQQNSNVTYRVFDYNRIGKDGKKRQLHVQQALRFLYKGIIIKHNKTEPTYTKTSLFLCEKRRFFMARTEKGVVATI
ncbi:MAG: type I phosphomannose isomerase catalytic subunit [Neglectibacter timonensis]